MYDRSIRILIALMATLLATAPAFAQYYNYARPHYNHRYYRGYAPYAPYYRPDHTVRNVAIGAGVGAVVGGLVGALASHHSYRYE